MTDSLYDIATVWITGVLLLSMVVAIEVGYRVGVRRQVRQSEAARGHITAVQASFLGVLGLVLGFTFSLSLSRYDSRSDAVLDEANAIGTAYLRTDLLPATRRTQARGLLQSYLDLRVRSGEVPLDHRAEWLAMLGEAARLQQAIWDVARQAVAEKPDPAVFGFVQSVNEMIDALGRRNAALDRHVPEVVVALLLVILPTAGLIVGYGAGVAGHRPSFVTYVLVMLIVLLVFIIIDLDRPRRGLIKVSSESLVDLQSQIKAAPE